MFKIFYVPQIHGYQIENPDESKWEKEGRFFALESIAIVPRGETVLSNPNFLNCIDGKKDFEIDLPMPKIVSSKSKPIECVTLVKNRVRKGKAALYILCIPADMVTPEPKKTTVTYGVTKDIQRWRELPNCSASHFFKNEAQKELQELCIDYREYGKKSFVFPCPDDLPEIIVHIEQVLEDANDYLEKFKKLKERIEESKKRIEKLVEDIKENMRETEEREQTQN